VNAGGTCWRTPLWRSAQHAGELPVGATSYRVRITNRNQFFMPGELPLVILALLSERRQGGYELLRELERRYGPAYRPSPGSIYPALAALRTERLVEAAESGRKAVFTPTPDGHRMLADQREVLDRVQMRTSKTSDDDRSLQALLGHFTDRVSRVGGRVDRAAVERILDSAATMIADLETQHGQ
jgi:DNA-binding PadR family transcriptional regulator